MRNRLHQTLAAVALLSILALGAADGVVRLLAERRLEIPYRNGLPDGAREALVAFNGLLLRATGRRMVSGTSRRYSGSSSKNKTPVVFPEELCGQS